MLAETGSGTKERWQLALERFAREHPRGFSLMLIVFTAAVAVGLLFAVAPPTVLYQGF